MTITAINRGKWERYNRDLSEFTSEEQSLYRGYVWFRRIPDGVGFHEVRSEFIFDDTVSVSASLDEESGNYMILTASGGGMPAYPDGLYLFTIHGWEGQIESLVRHYISGISNEVLPLPEPEPEVPSVISDRQFFQQLAAEGTITNAEALAAVRTGEIPSVLAIIISGIEDESSKFAAEMMLSGATQIERNHPLTSTIAFATGRSEADIDNFFREASLL